MDQIQLAQQDMPGAHYEQVDKVGQPTTYTHLQSSDMCETEEKKVVATPSR